MLILKQNRNDFCQILILEIFDRFHALNIINRFKCHQSIRTSLKQKFRVFNDFIQEIPLKFYILNVINQLTFVKYFIN